MSRPLAILVGLAAALLVVAGLRDLSDIIGPAFLALVLTIAAQPLRTWMAEHNHPAWLGSLVGMVVIYGVLLALTLGMIVSGSRFATLIPTYQPELQSTLSGVGNALRDAGVGDEQINALLDTFDLGRVVGVVAGLLNGLLGVLSSLVFVVALVLFMVVDAGTFGEKLRRLPQERRAVGEALAQFARGTRRYLVVSTIFGLVVAVLDTVALLIIGVPVALLWGLLAFITNYVPNIGFVIGVLPPAVIGLLEGGPGMMIAVILTYSVLNIVIQSVIQPRVVGDSVGLSGTVTMLSLVFWAYALGAIGALMAVPLTLLAKALLVDADPRTRWVGPLLAGGPPREPSAAGSTSTTASAS